MRQRGVRGSIGVAWRDANSSLWFLPAILVMGAVGLSVGLLYADARIGGSLAYRWWLFGGHAEGARAILAAIATSLITVISIAFSITVLAMQQAATQFTPRVLRNFTSDRGNQVVLGTYIATFVYALLVLRQVRSGDGDTPGFIPTLSIGAAVALAVTSLAMLIYFIHHTSQALQVSHLLASIRRELDPELARLFPTEFGVGGAEPPDFRDACDDAQRDTVGAALCVRASEEGYLRSLDEEALADALGSGDLLAVVPVRVGGYVARGTELVRCWGDIAERSRIQRARDAFVVSRERSIEQDPLFGIRQMADIALKALSPGINDPTTAEEAIEHLGAVMRLVIAREMPSPRRVLAGRSRVVLNVPSLREYVDESFGQIRRAARPHVHVTSVLLRVLGDLASCAPTAARARVVLEHASEILSPLGVEGITDRDAAAVRAAVADVFHEALAHGPSVPDDGDGGGGGGAS